MTDHKTLEQLVEDKFIIKIQQISEQEYKEYPPKVWFCKGGDCYKVTTDHKGLAKAIHSQIIEPMKLVYDKEWILNAEKDIEIARLREALEKIAKYECITTRDIATKALKESHD